MFVKAAMIEGNMAQNRSRRENSVTASIPWQERTKYSARICSP